MTWLALAALAAGGCGSEPRPAPGPRDIAGIGASLRDIVLECRSVSAGFVAAPDRAALRRDVDRLVATFERVAPDASFTVGRAPGPTRRTSAREELRLAGRTLTGCDARQAARVRDAARGG